MGKSLAENLQLVDKWCSLRQTFTVYLPPTAWQDLREAVACYNPTFRLLGLKTAHKAAERKICFFDPANGASLKIFAA